MSGSESLEGLVAGAASLGIALDDAQREAFNVYADLILYWGERINLLGPTAMQQLWSRHLLDALSLWRAVPERLRELGDALSLADVGSGAGIPGIPLQIAFPQWQVTLLEATDKRARFLNEVQRELRLSNLLVVAGRAEDAAHDREHREAYDLATARAVTHLAGLVEMTLPFITVGGAAILFKTLAGLSEEVEGAEPARVCVGAASPEVMPIGTGDDSRCLVRYRKVARTHGSLPRKAGLPEHRPLTHFDVEHLAQAREHRPPSQRGRRRGR